ncbi:MAG: enoyl-CoA hydratase-related protein [Pseudomonadales bacterium]
MSETVVKDLQDGVLLLTLNRPAKKNAFNNEQWIAFTEAILQAQQDNNVNVVVVTGAGADFSSGVDLSSFAEGDGEHPFDACAKAVAEFDKPLLMAAKGIAVGGGATLTFHADILYVGESLRMRLPFANLGLVPEFASSYLLQVNIGAQRAAELFYTAEWINADRAVETGIAARCYADAELLEKTLEKAREIAQWPVNALQETKRTLKIAHLAGIQAALQAEHSGMQKQAGSPENIEAITAFMEKRKPDFSKLK